MFWSARKWGWRRVFLLTFTTWLIAQTHVRDFVLNDFRDFAFIQLGPFDLLAWQFLWIGGLFVGQRFLEDKAFLPLPHLLRPFFFLLATTFLLWRWNFITFGGSQVRQTWLLDKWHLGPLRIINFSVTVCVVAPFLRHLSRWEAPLRPFLSIGRHMLAVFCSQICLSVLLLGRTESGLTVEPLTTTLVICQLLTAPIFAWFLEWRSAVKQSGRAIPDIPPTRQRVLSSERRMKENALPSRAVRGPALQPSSS